MCRLSVEARREKFINKSKSLHGDFYDYSQVVYVDNTTHVEIICPKHGPFKIQPSKHNDKKRLQGCPECYAESRSDSIEIVSSEIEKRGGTLLDPMSGEKNYVMSKARIRVQCNACSKIWTPQWRTIKVSNRWCGVCTSKYAKSMSFGDVKGLAAELDLEVLEFPNNPLSFVNAPDKLKLKCKVCDHTQTKTLHAIKLCKKGDMNGCKNCSSFAKGSRTFEEIQETLEEHGFEVLEFPDNGKIKKTKYRDVIKIKCSKGHVQETNLCNIYGNGLTRYGRVSCRLCANEAISEARSMSYEEFLQRAGEKYAQKFKYPEENRKTWTHSHGKVKIVCDKHGEQEILPTTFLNSNLYGCPVCAKEGVASKLRPTLEEYNEKLKKRKNNILCISDEYLNNTTHLLHKCLACDHQWTASPASTLKSSGCPECSKSHYRERWTREVLEEIFAMKFPSTRPDWLRNPETNRKLEVDCYCEELGLGLEYQGAQHYEAVEFWGGEKALLSQQRRDIAKTNIFMKKKQILWRIDNRPLNTLDEKEFKIKITEAIRDLALSEHFTPSWFPNGKKIKSFFLTTNSQRVIL